LSFCVPALQALDLPLQLNDSTACLIEADCLRRRRRGEQMTLARSRMCPFDNRFGTRVPTVLKMELSDNTHDGIWGPLSEAAADRFRAGAGLPKADGIDTALLQAVRIL